MARRKHIVPTLAFVMALAVPAHAEEGGSAHYAPGATASFIDAFPGKPGALAVLNLFTFYGAEVAANRTLPLGGSLTAGMDATVYADTLVAVYQLPFELFDGAGTWCGGSMELTAGASTMAHAITRSFISRRTDHPIAEA